MNHSMKILKLMQIFSWMESNEDLLTHITLRPIGVVLVNMYVQAELY